MVVRCLEMLVFIGKVTGPTEVGAAAARLKHLLVAEEVAEELRKGEGKFSSNLLFRRQLRA